MKTFRLLVAITFLLVFCLNLLSAYIRLQHAGLGCEDWPQCYGLIGDQTPVTSIVEDPSSYQALLKLQEQTPWTGRAHRAIAGAISVLVLLITVMAFRPKSRALGIPRAQPVWILLLTAFLSALGIWSGGLTQPAVVLGNLLGGFLLLALLWWLLLQTRSTKSGSKPFTYSGTITMAIALLGIQLFLGGMVSAQFAANSCTDFPNCGTQWWPPTHNVTLFTIFDPLELDTDGRVIVTEAGPTLHMIHRLGALITGLFIIYMVGIARISRHISKNTKVIIWILLITQIGLGISAVLFTLPIAMITAHNGLAALLLLTLMALYFRDGDTQHEQTHITGNSL